MGFGKYKISDWLQASDLPHQGAVATVSHATYDMQDNFRTKEKEMKVTLYFNEFKPMTLTNTNLTTLEECFPHLDHTSIGGTRVWLKGVEVDAFGELKTVVRIDKLQTLRMQPDPTAGATPSDRPPTPVDNGIPPSEPAHMRDTPPPPTDDQVANAFPDAQDDVPF